MIKLFDYQEIAIRKMHNGCILCGGVGSGKSLTSLAYFLRNCREKPLYIITTARKRDLHEWEDEIRRTGEDISAVVDSWNNIKKYEEIRDGFFIFDEQRVVGSGTWVKAFLKIAKANKWILLSATPGDTWKDYIPVFLANGFYKSRSSFNMEHVIFSPYVSYPKILRYVNEDKLEMERSWVLVNMDFQRKTESHHTDIFCEYDERTYKAVLEERKNPWTGEPLVNAGELCYTWRKVANSGESRIAAVKDICNAHPRVIIFYNFDYELEMLKGIDYGCDVAEWNGHRHEDIPEGENWVYLVQYTAGCEGWNCTTCDTVIFFSQNYSWKVTKQAEGRIDRLNTMYHDLYYYHLVSHAPIDEAIKRAVKAKKIFNEKNFVLAE